MTIEAGQAPPRAAENDRAAVEQGATILSATRGGEKQGALDRVTLALFIAVPFLALFAAVPVAWGWGLSWLDAGLAVGMYFLTCHGITIGYHRYFTHGAFKANR